MVSAVRFMSSARIQKTLVHGLSWISLTSVLLYRAQLTRDITEPYAEDGSSLILGAFSSPWNLLAPVVDAIFILPRLFGALATLASPSHAPFLMAIFSTATLALIALYFTRQSLWSIAPSLIHRYLVCLIIIANIGTIEVAGSGMCTSYVLSLFLVGLALEVPRLKATFLVPLVLILSFSTNSSFIAAPLFFLRGISSRDPWLIACAILTLVPIPVTLALAAFSLSPHSLGSFAHLGVSLVAIADRLIFYSFVAPFGGGLMININDWARLLLILASILVYLYLWYRSSCKSRLISASLVAGAALYLTAHQFGRPYNIAGSILDFRLTADRFTFLLVPYFCIAWSVLIFDQERLSVRAKNVAFSLMVVVQLTTTALYGSSSSSTDQIKSWQLFVSQLEEGRRSPAGAIIDDMPVNPIQAGVPWGLVHCDTSNDRYVTCSDQRGNRDGVVYEIPKVNA